MTFNDDRIASYTYYVNISRPRPFLPLRVPRKPPHSHVSKSNYMRFNAWPWQPLRAISSFRESLSINTNITSSSSNNKGDIRNKPIEAANSIWTFVSQMGKRLDNEIQNQNIIENNENEVK